MPIKMEPTAYQQKKCRKKALKPDVTQRKVIGEKKTKNGIKQREI